MAQKIKNVRVSRTAQQENDSWAEVKSYRNKHLANSDWTQFNDTGLTEANVRQWTDWRRELRRINRSNFATKELAYNSLQTLARMEPTVEYTDESILLTATFSDYTMDAVVKAKKIQSMKLLNKKFNLLVENNEFLTNPLIVNEQYEEAVLYLSATDKNIDQFPLIKLEMELLGLSTEAVLRHFLNAQRNKLRVIIVLKRKFSFFQNAINSATNMVQLDNIQREMQEWTLTLT